MNCHKLLLVCSTACSSHTSVSILFFQTFKCTLLTVSASICVQVTFSLNGVKTCCLSSTELTSPVSSLAAFEPQSAVQGQIEVLLALRDRVVKFNLDGTENTVLQSTPGKLSFFNQTT